MADTFPHEASTENTSADRRPSQPLPATRRGRAVLAALLVLLLLVRLVAVLVPDQHRVQSDASGYDAAARRLLETGSFAFPIGKQFWEKDAFRESSWQAYLKLRPNAFSMPGYPIFLAGVYGASGTGDNRFAAVRVVQAFIAVLGALLLFMLVKEVTGERAAWVAFVLWALYPANSWVTGYLLTETLFTTLLIGLVLAMAIAARSPRVGPFIAVGLLTACATWVRPIVLLLPLLLAGYLFVRLLVTRAPGGDWRRAFGQLAVAALVVVVAMAPWVARNHRVYGGFVPLSSAPSIGKMVRLNRGYWLGFPAPVLAQTMDLSKWGGNDHAFDAYLGWYVRKAMRTMSPEQHTQARRRFLRDLRVSLTSPFVFFSTPYNWPNWLYIVQVLLIGFAAVGVVASLRNPVALVFLLGVPLYLVVFQLLTYFVKSRYVYPAMPFIVALAAVGVVGLVDVGSRVTSARTR